VNEVLRFVAAQLGDTVAVVVETYISGGFDGDTARYEGVLGGRPVTRPRLAVAR
jgi:hypothetical protein